MTEQEVRHVSDRYQQPHGGEGVRRAGGGSPVPGGYLSGDPGAGQRSGVYRPPAVQPSAVRQSAAPRDALSHGGTVGSAPDSGRGGVPHHVGGHHPHRYLHAAGSGEDAPAYSGGLSDDRLLSGEEYLRLLRGAYEKRRNKPPRTPMCPGRFISAVDGIPAYAVGTARGNI